VDLRDPTKIQVVQNAHNLEGARKEADNSHGKGTALPREVADASQPRDGAVQTLPQSSRAVSGAAVFSRLDCISPGVYRC
jgi:hypothetical protein